MFGASDKGERTMQRWECYSAMIQGGLDGINDALSGIPRCANANRSHSYRYAYGDGYTSAKTLKAKARDKVAEELAIKADQGII